MTTTAQTSVAPALVAASPAIGALPACYCEPAAETVQLQCGPDTKNAGKYFYACSIGRPEAGGCGYFQFVGGPRPAKKRKPTPVNGTAPSMAVPGAFTPAVPPAIDFGPILAQVAVTNAKLDDLATYIKDMQTRIGCMESSLDTLLADAARRADTVEAAAFALRDRTGADSHARHVPLDPPRLVFPKLSAKRPAPPTLVFARNTKRVFAPTPAEIDELRRGGPAAHAATTCPVADYEMEHIVDPDDE